jgi:hypothetical protein
VAARDLKKQLKDYYGPSAREVTIVDVPSMNLLMVDGAGDPNPSQAYKEAVAALYAASYTLKFMLKRRNPENDYGVMPLEGLWWTDDPASFSFEQRAGWRWTAMIVQPDVVTPALVAEAIAEAARKRDLPALAWLRFAPFHEGKAAQILHVGPYAAEPPTIERLHRFIADHGGRLTGRHHEIFLNDPGRTAPERLRTIIRQPYA